ncbi:hypothetical protein HYH03_001538 [Edaphochlamys debaryana]|uniref:Uncharacterized protein n=1 Tax=Edaphochlamys debaryana TaxID=47281 RepID=A0A835YDV4_9CHLO|nr:hypothetical protein HYH03_001538 [Edaphochlamys debaryana]|eukprot:KAG2500776.1 hypothetical protein HYH03_001538 [Edaphochlamys debaryana]
MSQHQLHTGQTTISGIPHNDSVHNLLADQGATVYGNSAATSKLNIFGKGKALSSWATAKAKACLRDVHAALVVAAIVAIIDTIKATGGQWSKLCLRGNERVKRGDALSTLHNDGAYQGNPWHFLFNIGCTAIDLLCADGAGGFVKHMLMPGAFLISSKAWFVSHRHKAVGAGNGSSLRIIGIFYPAPGMPVQPSAEMTIKLASLFSSTYEAGPRTATEFLVIFPGLSRDVAASRRPPLLPAPTYGYDTLEAWLATSTPEQRSERSRKAVATRLATSTPEQRSANAREAWEAMEERGNGLPAYMAGFTPEQWSERTARSYQTLAEEGRGLPAYMAAATPDQRSTNARKAWETQEKRGNGLVAATPEQLSKAYLKRRLGMCQCGKCKRCWDRASATRCRAAKKAAAKAVVGTVVEVVDLAED